MSRTYYEFEISYKGKKVDRFLIPASSDANAHDEAAQKATDKTGIKLLRIIGPDDGERSEDSDDSKNGTGVTVKNMPLL